MKTIIFALFFSAFLWPSLWSQNIDPCNYPDGKDSLVPNFVLIDTFNSPIFTCYQGQYLCLDSSMECATIALPDSAVGKLFVCAYDPDSQIVELILTKNCDSVVLDSCKLILSYLTSGPCYEIWLNYQEPSLQLHICGKSGAKVFIIFQTYNITQWENLDTCLHDLDTMCPPTAIIDPIPDPSLLGPQRYILLNGEVREVLPEKGTIYYDTRKGKKFLNQ